MLKKIAGAAVLLLAFWFYVGDPLRTTPGFFLDESSIAYNALTAARTGLDEHGVRLPLYFEAFGEYKNPVYIYLLAALFRVTGPSILAARMLSIVLGYLAALMLGWLVRRQGAPHPALRATLSPHAGRGATLGRMTGGGSAAGAFTFLAALMTPWLFEISRLVFEVAAFPLALALALFAIAEVSRRERVTPWLAIGCAASLAMVTYTYTAGRLLGPAMALGLALLWPRRGVRELVAIWCAYGVTMIPLVIFVVRHPHALTARLDELGVAHGNFFAHYLASFSLKFLFAKGDLNARHHIAFGGELFASVVIVTMVGLVLAVRQARRDPWSRFLLFLLVIAPIPGAITQDEDPHALRLITIAVVAIVFAGSGVAALFTLQTEKRLRVILVASLFVAMLAQGIVFRQKFEKLGPLRFDEFCVTYPYVFDVAYATRQPLGVEENPYYINAWWYGALRGVERELLPRYQRDTEPRGTVMLGIVHDCPSCRVLADLRGFWAYRRE